MEVWWRLDQSLNERKKKLPLREKYCLSLPAQKSNSDSRCAFNIETWKSFDHKKGVEPCLTQCVEVFR